MEIEFKDLTIGYTDKVYFNLMENDSHKPDFTVRLMATEDQKSLVMIYQWVDHTVKKYSDREEAFYIDGLTPENFELAKNIFIDVYNELKMAYDENPNSIFDMTSCVEAVIEKYKSKSK